MPITKRPETEMLVPNWGFGNGRNRRPPTQASYAPTIVRMRCETIPVPKLAAQGFLLLALLEHLQSGICYRRIGYRAIAEGLRYRFE